MSSLVKLIINFPIKQSFVMRSFSITAQNRDQWWRENNGLPTNPNSFGPLTNLPDFSYMDGRITPLGTNQMKRLKYQQKIAKQIVTSLKELDYAKKRYARLQADNLAKKKQIISEKLQPKGTLLLTK